MNARGNVVGYGAVEGGDDSEELLNSYYIIDGGMEQSVKTIKRRTRTKRQKNAMSLFDSYIFLVKGNIGSGILALPQAFSDAGYALSTVFIIFTGILAIHCMAILVDSVHFIVERWHLVSLEYGQTTEWAFLNLNSNTVNFGCCKVRKAQLGLIGKIVVNFFLIVTQLGFGIVYFVLMANTLNSVTTAIGFTPLNLRVWVVVLFVPMVALSWIREMKSLSPLIFIANLCILFVLFVIMYDIFQRFHAGSTAVQCIPPMVNGSVTVTHDVCVDVSPGCGVVAVNTSPSAFNQVFLFFAIAVYAYEGIGVVLPLENKMKKPQYFKQILYSAMGTVMAMFLSLGLLGYLAYGKCVQGNVTTNLVTDFLPLKILYLVAQLYVGYVIYVSFAQAFYVPMDFLEPPLLELLKLSDSSSLSNRSKVDKTVFHILFRSGIVTLLCGFALIEPSHLADVMSLVGAFASTSLALIFPPAIHILVFAFGQGGGASGLNRHLQSPTVIDNVNQSSDENESVEDAESEDDDSNSDKDDDSQSSTPLIIKKKIVILKYWWVVKDLAIICFGLVCSVIGTYASFDNLIKNFN